MQLDISMFRQTLLAMNTRIQVPQSRVKRHKYGVIKRIRVYSSTPNTKNSVSRRYGWPWHACFLKARVQVLYLPLWSSICVQGFAREGINRMAQTILGLCSVTSYLLADCCGEQIMHSWACLGVFGIVTMLNGLTLWSICSCSGRDSIVWSPALKTPAKRFGYHHFAGEFVWGACGASAWNQPEEKKDVIAMQTEGIYLSFVSHSKHRNSCYHSTFNIQSHTWMNSLDTL